MEAEQRLLRFGQIYRYARPEQAEVPSLDGLPNFYWHTATRGMPKAKLERGISRLPVVSDGADGTRVPAILIRSTPWKAGTQRTPWHDDFDADTGTVLYYGDNKIDEKTGAPKESDPSHVLGNQAMLAAQFAHAAPDATSRWNSAPILVFTGLPFDGRAKGNVRFDGLGVVKGASMVRQEDETTGQPYSNFLFEIRLLDLGADEDAVDWAWISARRHEGLTRDVTSLAPVSWTRWCRDGNRILDEIALRYWRVMPLSGV